MRSIHDDIIRTITQDKKMAFIAGPRQVGKTTLAQLLLKEGKSEEGYFNWDIDPIRKSIIHDPIDFWRPLDRPPSTRIALDEIHKYPRWKRFLKGFYDANKGKTEIMVTGSGRLDIFQRGGDSLFGRYHLYHLFPYTLGEMLAVERDDLSPEICLQKIFDPPPRDASDHFNHLWNLNGFPEPLFSGQRRTLNQWQMDHRQLILKEELRDLTQIRELGLMESLMDLLPQRISAPLSINSLREELQVNFRTVQNWLLALTRLYYLFSILPYSKNLTRSLRQEKKIYFYDWSELEDEGKRFENLLALHLWKACHYWTEAGYGVFRLFYCRDKEKREVDFLICQNTKPFILIEGKLSQQDLDHPLLYFHSKLKPKYTFQVTKNLPPNSMRQTEKGIYLISPLRLLHSLP